MELAINLIKHFESLHDGDLHVIGLQPKLCPAGVWTIGWGRAVIDPSTGKFLKGAQNKKRALQLYPALTVEQADAMLEEDYNRFQLSVNELLSRNCLPHQLGAMTSLAYNIGLGNFKKSSVLRYFNGGNLSMAAESFKLWVKSDGKVLKGLQKRRQAELHLFLHNELKLN